MGVHIYESFKIEGTEMAPSPYIFKSRPHMSGEEHVDIFAAHVDILWGYGRDSQRGIL